MMITRLPTQKNVQIQPEALWPAQFLYEIVCKYQDHEMAQGRYLEIEPNPTTIILTTDRNMLEHVLGQMVLLGLAATASGESVRLAFTVDAGRIIFQVHYRQNSQAVEANYVKQLVEEFLHGKFAYKVHKQGGTILAASLPIYWPQK